MGGALNKPVYKIPKDIKDKIDNDTNEYVKKLLKGKHESIYQVASYGELYKNKRLQEYLNILPDDIKRKYNTDLSAVEKHNFNHSFGQIKHKRKHQRKHKRKHSNKL
jgi:hypothetical protein